MRGLLLDITPLRGREFRLLFLGQLISFFGSMITFVALPFQMYDLTGSMLAVGALGACEFVPIVTVALVSGALADAFDRRLLVLASELGSAAVMAALLANALLDEPRVWVLFVYAAVLAGFYALLRPPLDSGLGAVPQRDLEPDDPRPPARPARGRRDDLPHSGPPLGNFEAGVVASFAGVRASIVSGGVMCVVGTGVVLAFLPALWRYDARRPAPREEAPAGSGAS